MNTIYFICLNQFVFTWGGTERVTVLKSIVIQVSMQGKMKKRPGPLLDQELHHLWYDPNEV